jgi:hydrogenase-4 component B
MIFVAWSIGLMVAAGAFGAALWRRPAAADLVYRLCVAGAVVAGVIPAVRVLAGGAVASVSLATSMPGGSWVFGVDPLTALFLVLILAAGSANASFGVTYLRDRATARAARASHFFVATLLAALVTLVVARAALPFLIAWEAMALTSYAAIVLDHGRAGVRRAGMLYLVAMHVGTLALFALFAVWGSGAPDLTFASLGARTLGGASQVAVLGAALVGFGMKAGLVPLHFWLPEAHAAAPTHVSAMMSGVVIKMGIYGLLRTTWLMGLPPMWWGWFLLTAGAVSGVLGVVWALAQHDLKRLLAFHSVENIGIILIGVGAGCLGITSGHPLVAVLGFAGAVLHTLNHALFKSLLFLGAGSMTHATGTRQIDHLGGVFRGMPVTALTFVIGSAAIVGLPPLNGFVSEWLVFRSLLHAGLLASGARMAVFAVAVLGLIGALALACFAKVVGVVFLGRPRDAAASAAHESPAGMTGPLVALAAACGVIGGLPIVAVPSVLRVGAVVAGTPLTAVWATGGDPAVWGATRFSLGLAAALGVVWIAAARWGARRVRVTAETWGCAFPSPTARMQYTASSFAAPLLTAYRGVAGIRTERTALALATHAGDPVLDGVVEPAWHGIEQVARRMRPLQRGRLSLYLLYVVAALVAVLGYLMLAGRTS